MKSKTIILFIIGAVIVVGITFYRYQILLEYYTWRLQNSDSKYVEDCENNLMAIAPHVKNSMAQIYLKESISMSRCARITIGDALTKADKFYAERVFCNGLSSQSTQVIAASIENLAFIKSTVCCDKIYKLSDNEDSDVRFSVVSYISNFNDPRSLNLLKKMATTDKDPEVKKWATSRLQTLGQIP